MSKCGWCGQELTTGGCMTLGCISKQVKTIVKMPWSPGELLKLQSERADQWDQWYGRLPKDITRKLSLHDFKRLGDLFKDVFKIQ